VRRGRKQFVEPAPERRGGALGLRNHLVNDGGAQLQTWAAEGSRNHGLNAASSSWRNPASALPPCRRHENLELSNTTARDAHRRVNDVLNR
jgi:hypothetical protein